MEKHQVANNTLCMLHDEARVVKDVGATIFPAFLYHDFFYI